MADPWVQTVSGRAFDLLDPKTEDVSVGDVAHSLARTGRFSGHTQGEVVYTVGHHALLVADLLASWGAPPIVVFEGLHHDDAESAFGDTTSPVQRAARVMLQSKLLEHFERGVLTWGPHGYQEVDAIDRLARELDPLRQLRERIEPVFRTALGLPEHEHPLVKRADLVALAIERRDLFGGVSEPRDWRLPEHAPVSAPLDRIHGSTRPRQRIDPDRLLIWENVRDAFIGLHRELLVQVAKAGAAEVVAS